MATDKPDKKSERWSFWLFWLIILIWLLVFLWIWNQVSLMGLMSKAAREMISN